MIELLESLLHLTEAQDFDSLFKSVSIEDLAQRQGWIKNPDGTYDCEGVVNLFNMDLERLPVKFRWVGGYFDCSKNHLTTLEGAPQKVGWDFYCFNNHLTSLKGAPQTVGGGFYCSHNRLTSLQGAPQTVGGHFYCDDNPLSFEELKGTVNREYIKWKT